MNTRLRLEQAYSQKLEWEFKLSKAISYVLKNYCRERIIEYNTELIHLLEQYRKERLTSMIKPETKTVYRCPYCGCDIDEEMPCCGEVHGEYLEVCEVCENEECECKPCLNCDDIAVWQPHKGEYFCQECFDGLSDHVKECIIYYGTNNGLNKGD